MRQPSSFSDQPLTEILYVVGTYMFISPVLRTGHVPSMTSGRRPPSAGQAVRKPKPITEIAAKETLISGPSRDWSIQ
jgi:hypothetical protein